MDPSTPEHRTNASAGVDVGCDATGASVARDQRFRSALRHDLERDLGSQNTGLPDHRSVGAATKTERNSKEENKSAKGQSDTTTYRFLHRGLPVGEEEINASASAESAAARKAECRRTLVQIIAELHQSQQPCRAPAA